VVTAITHPNATAEIALQYWDIILTAARTVDKGGVDIDQNARCENLKIHAVPYIRSMEQGMDGLQKMCEECVPQNTGIVIPTEVRWLGNPHTIRERR